MASGSAKDVASAFSASFDLNRTADQGSGDFSNASLMGRNRGFAGLEGGEYGVSGNVGDDSFLGFDDYFGVNFDHVDEKGQDFGYQDVSNPWPEYGGDRSAGDVVVGDGGHVGGIGSSRSNEAELPKGRGRGRPPKTDTLKGVCATDGDGFSIKRSRGRPPKANSPASIGKFAVVVYNAGTKEINGDTASVVTPSKRGRGRPRKSLTMTTAIGIDRFADQVAASAVTNGIGSSTASNVASVVGNVVGVADGFVFIDEESYKEGGRGSLLETAGIQKEISPGVVGSGGVGGSNGVPVEEQTTSKRGRGRPRKIMKMSDGTGGFPDQYLSYETGSNVTSSVFGTTNGTIQVTEKVTSNKRDSSGTLKSSTVMKQDLSDRFYEDTLVKEDTSELFFSGFAGNGVGTADGDVQVIEKESCEKRGRGRPSKAATKDIHEGRFHERMTLVATASTMIQDGCGIFDDEVVVSEDMNDNKNILGVASNGVSSRDAIGEVLENSPKKKRRGRPPKSATMKTQGIEGRSDVDAIGKKDASSEVGSIISANGVNAVGGSVQVVEEGASKKRGRGRPPKSAVNRNQDNSLLILVQENSEKREQGRPDPLAIEDYEYDISDSEQTEVSARKRWRGSQPGDEENTQERNAAAEKQKTSRTRRGRRSQASYSFPFQDEKKIGFVTYDLVWGKGRRPLWWPGQIFDPSLASKMALDTPKEGQFLVAYFGDNTLGWCDESELVFFQSNFPQMAKQKCMDSFQTAVGAALEDVSKRVQFSMICSCYRSGTYASRLNQKLRKSGITEGACGSAENRSWIVDTFDPKKLVEYLHALAALSKAANSLDLAIVKAQLDAFHHSKGYLDRPVLLVDKEKGLQYDEEDFTGNSQLSGKKHEVAHLESMNSVKTVKEGIGLLADGHTNSLANYSKVEKPVDTSSEVAAITTGYAQDSYKNGMIINDFNPSDPKVSSPGTAQLEPGRSLICLQQVDESMPTELYLIFGDSCTLPSVDDLVKIFGQYGPLREEKTKIIPSLQYAQVVFKKRSDAQIAEALLRGAGEYSLFGQACSGYRLDLAGPTVSNPGSIQRLEPKKPLLELVDGEVCKPTELILTFSDSHTLPSVADLVKICGQYGPLREEETEVVRNLKVARVVFKRHTDAEIAESAISRAGKYSFFGQAQVLSCELKNLLEFTLKNFSLPDRP